MSRPSRPPICSCEHPVHFEKDAAKLREGRYGENHPVGARCTYVVRADVGGALICGACNRAGHGAVRHPDAFERFNTKQSTQTTDRMRTSRDSGRGRADGGRARAHRANAALHARVAAQEDERLRPLPQELIEGRAGGRTRSPLTRIVFRELPTTPAPR